MDQLLVLIASTGSRALDAEAMAAVTPLIASEPRWLAETEAVEAPLRADATQDAIAALRERLAGRPIDLCLVPAANRKKRLLIADMDSTIIEQECVDELAEAAGIGDQIKAITARAMRGELVFEEALRERVALLAELSEDVIGKVIAERITYRPGGDTLVATMRAHGAFTAIVSGGFTQFTSAVAAACGFDLHRANELDHLGRPPHRRGEGAHPRQGRQGGSARCPHRRARHHTGRCHRGGRRRQRCGDAAGSRPRRRHARQAGGARGGRCRHRPRRPHRPALPARLCAQRVGKRA